jgi:acetoacetate decarboxylase
MATFGSLGRDSIAYAMPVASGLYEPAPTVYKGIESINVRYHTDLDAVRPLVPDFLEIVEPATVSVVVLHIPHSMLGKYDEVQVQVLVRHEDTIRNYNILMYLSEAAPIALGRELLGAPKKGGHVELRHEAEGWVGTLHRPKGVPLMTVLMNPVREIEPGSMNVTTGFGLMVHSLHHPEGAEQEDRAYLVETPVSSTVHEQWTGPGGIGYHVHSDLDPLYRLPVRELLPAVYTRMDLSHQRGRVVTEWKK